MRHQWPKNLAMLLVLVPLLLTQGCPNSAIIENVIGSVRVLSATSPSTTGRWEIATFTINQIELLPLDPDASASLGGTNIGVLVEPVVIPLDIAATPLGATEVTAGRYEVVNIVLQGFLLQDTTVPLPPPSVCLDLIDTLQITFNPAVQFVDFDPPVEILVPDNGMATVTITIDSPGLIALLESHAICSVFNNCGTVPPPCIEGFVPVTAEELDPYITVQ